MAGVDIEQTIKESFQKFAKIWDWNFEWISDWKTQQTNVKHPNKTSKSVNKFL